MFKRLSNFLNSSANDLEPELNKNLPLSSGESVAGKVESYLSSVEDTNKEINADATICYDLEKVGVSDDTELHKFYLVDWVSHELKDSHDKLQALKTRIETLNTIRRKAALVNTHLNTPGNTSPFVEYDNYNNGDRYQLLSDGEKLICIIQRK